MLLKELENVKNLIKKYDKTYFHIDIIKSTESAKKMTEHCKKKTLKKITAN